MDLVGAAPAVEAAQQARACRSSRSAARSGGGRPRRRLRIVSSRVVVALHQARAVLVADALVLGWVEVDVVDVAGVLHAHAPRRPDGARPPRRGPRSAARRSGAGRGRASASASASACCSLRGKPSSRKPSRASPLGDALGDHADDHLVGHELARVHVALGLACRARCPRPPARAGCRRWRCAAARSRRAGGRPGCPCRRRADRAGSGSARTRPGQPIRSRARSIACRPQAFSLREVAAIARRTPARRYFRKPS